MTRKTAGKVVSSLFGLGYVPFAPGTFGAAGAVAVYAVFLSDLQRFEFAVFCAVFCAVSVRVCGEAAAAFGEKDPKKIVMDEAAGLFVAMIFCSGNIWEIAAGFFLFRFFDIVKIYPSRQIEKLPGGWGIVMDDVYAGLLAGLCVAILKVSGVAGFG